MKNMFASFFLFCFITTVRSQCSSTAFNSGTIFSTDNIIGVYNFSAPGNAGSSDNARASAASLIAILTGNTYYLKATGFNFGIPAAASICGVTLEAECRATGLLLTAAVRDNSVRLIKGGAITGSNYAKAGDWGATDAYRSYGGAADLWGTTLTPAEVNAADFGVAFSARIIALVAALPNAQIDHLRIRIDYSLVLPVHLVYFKSGIENNAVSLEWKTNNEEDDGMITLQRSPGNHEWMEMSRYKQTVYNNHKIYKYEDAQLQPGKYTYRLKIRSALGTETYSEVRHAEIGETKHFSVYPNPVKNGFITIGPLQATDHIFITDILSRQWTLPLETAQTNFYRINLQSLQQGVYFIQAGKKMIKLLKL